MVFTPDLTTLLPPQRKLWPELTATPAAFTLYGGTALALRLGHRASVDFDFFSNATFDPDQLANRLLYLKDAERVQVAPNTLTCRVQRDGPVLVSFFGRLGLGQVAPHDEVQGMGLRVASLLDIAGTKAAVVQRRAEVKDYLDLDALLRHGIDLPMVLAAGMVVYGRRFNPLITLKPGRVRIAYLFRALPYAANDGTRCVPYWNYWNFTVVTERRAAILGNDLARDRVRAHL
jgi:hypothetical protein